MFFFARKSCRFVQLLFTKQSLVNGYLFCLLFKDWFEVWEEKKSGSAAVSGSGVHLF